MKKFESFCKNIHKNDAGYVPDLLDLVAQGFGDLCMAAYLWDNCGGIVSWNYNHGSESEKNETYSFYESECQDAIDAYNQTIDDAREADNDMELLRDEAWIGICDPCYKWQRFNQAEIDAGFSGTGREF
jgi:hypothetical protein